MDSRIEWVIPLAEAADSAVEPGRLLRLRVEAKMPGRFWLQFEAQSLEGKGSKTRAETPHKDDKR